MNDLRPAGPRAVATPHFIRVAVTIDGTLHRVEGHFDGYTLNHARRMATAAIKAVHGQKTTVRFL